MSILPSRNLSSATSASSSSSSSQSPSPNHGFAHEPSLSHQTQSFRISADLQGSVSSTGGNPGGSSKKVNGSGRSNHYRSSTHGGGGKTLQQENVPQPEFGLPGHQGQTPGNLAPPSSRQNSGSQGSTTHMSGRRSQVVSGNHLLNFHYEPIPISRPQPRTPLPRRQQKKKPYNKDLFLQANYKFVVLDSGNFSPESMDPDKSLDWEDIICLKYSSPLPVQCPICLEDPLCPQITSCGHIFCFPCILQYFCIDEDERKGEYWKKCPLCFTMISSKDLYTVHIDNVRQYHIGDIIEFVLLTRQKDSFTLSIKNKEGIGSDKSVQNSFSKFVLTSDVDLSVREAMSDLDSWLAKADSGLVDNIEKLPYVCAAIEQLEQRRKYWNERCISSGNEVRKSSHRSPPTTDSSCTALESHLGTVSSGIKVTGSEKSSPGKADGKFGSSRTEDAESLEDNNGSFPSHNDNRNENMHPIGFKEKKDKDSYDFYQALDGQHFILHPLNMKCLLHHYGSYEKLPGRISGKILQLETVTQSEAMRKRYRFLSHFSLTTTFQLCEIDLTGTLPAESLSPFMDEIKARQKQRKRFARREQKEKIKAEAASTDMSPIPYYLAQSSYDSSPSFSIDDFEALGGASVTSSSPPAVGERQSFSSVARFGFAAGHDSPALRTEEAQPHAKLLQDSSPATGLSNAGTLSFASVTSRVKADEAPEVPKVNEAAKKGKKPSRVLLSTAGGRRY